MYIYRFKDREGNIVYIGKTMSLNGRISTHFTRGGHLHLEDYQCVHRIEVAPVASRIDMDILELYLINKYLPRLNNTGAYESEISFSIDYKLNWETAYLRESIERMIKARMDREALPKKLDDWIDGEILKYALFTDKTTLINRLSDVCALFHDQLTPSQKSVLMYLCERSLDSLGATAVSKSEMASDLGITRRTAMRSCQKLDSLGILRQEVLKRPFGGDGPCVIYFLPSDAVIKPAQ